jgi:hypothetical protein
MGVDLKSAGLRPVSDVDEVEQIETDYLVIGAGAMGIAFIDVLLKEDSSADVVVVDRHASPGGHWNDAYSFVTLHQPAAFYGLTNLSLGRGGSDLTSLPEIVAYFGEAMRRFVESGRVRFLPMSDYQEDGTIVSVLNPDQRTRVSVRKRLVDATYLEARVPSVVAPLYDVDADVELVPPNGLSRLRRHYEHHVVVGSGKTGIDAILFLLDRGVAPTAITWIVPNDAWLWAREPVQPGLALTTVAEMVQAVADSESADEAFATLEERGLVFRLDRARQPTKWRCASVARDELVQLRSVADVVRMGRVERISRGSVALSEGEHRVPEDSLFVDCTANGLASAEPKPIFADGTITLQSVFMCQQTFSASLIGRLAVARFTDDKRNQILSPVPHPEAKEDLVTSLLASTQNTLRFSRRFPWWLRRNRLFLGSHEALHRYLISSVNLRACLRRAISARRWEA